MPEKTILQFDVDSEVDRYFDDSSLTRGAAPRFIVLLGGIAAGKTTIRKERFSRGYVLVDAAEVFLHLSRGEVLPFPGPFEKVMETIGNRVAWRAIAERRHIVTEMIGSDFEPLKELLKTMRAVGYSTAAEQVTCDLEEAQRRNLARGTDNISCYYAEPYQRRWLLEAARPVPVVSDVPAQWRFGGLLDYFDDSQSRLIELSKRLAALPDADQAVALDTVRGEVARLTNELTDEILPQVSVSVIESLYKSASVLTQWGSSTQQYVQAMWGTFFTVLADRGYLMHYVVENTFPEHLDRPLTLYPHVFGAAGFVYLCPHQLATTLPEAAGLERTIDSLRSLLTEARHLAVKAATSAKNRHLMYLEIDFEPGCLDAVLELRTRPGVIQVFRNEAPLPGSKVAIAFPKKRVARKRKPSSPAKPPRPKDPSEQ